MKQPLMFGAAISYKQKIIKHMSNNNHGRVKDYLLWFADRSETKVAFINTVGQEPIDFMKVAGWKLQWSDSKNILMLTAPDGSYYHSD